tara:strand:+ start:1016 stop:1204 length:189 start_codon:yes stop_codon:yes gene_type:complete
MRTRANRIAETVELVEFSVSAMSFQSRSSFKGSANERNLLLFRSIGNGDLELLGWQLSAQGV